MTYGTLAASRCKWTGILSSSFSAYGPDNDAKILSL